MVGFIFNKRKKIGKKTTLNLSKSGASITKRSKAGSINTRGKGSVRLGKGFRWKF